MPAPAMARSEDFRGKIAVKATIHTLDGNTAHAGQTDLMRWFDVIAPSKPRVVLTSERRLPDSFNSATGYHRNCRK